MEINRSLVSFHSSIVELSFDIRFFNSANSDFKNLSGGKTSKKIS